MSANPLFFAPYRTPLVDPATGLISRPWYSFLQGIFNRVGGSTGTGSDDLEQLVTEDLDIAGIDQLAIAQTANDAQMLDLDLPDPPSTDASDALMLLLDREEILPPSANPSAKVGLAAINGVASSYMRSDGAPALDVAITVTWTGVHAFQSTNLTPVAFGGISFTGAMTIGASNTSTTSGDTVRYSLTAGSTNLAIFAANQNQAAALVTGGPATPQAAIRTLGAQPIVFGVNNTYGGQFESATSFRLAGAIGINGNASFAQPTGYGTPTGGAHQASFAAGSITLPNLAAAVAQLIIELKSYGLLGT